MKTIALISVFLLILPFLFQYFYGKKSLAQNDFAALWTYCRSKCHFTYRIHLPKPIFSLFVNYKNPWRICERNARYRNNPYQRHIISPTHGYNSNPKQ